MLLLIDAGNSRTKWGCYDNGIWVARGACSNLDLDSLAQAWAGLPAPSRVIGCNVAGCAVAVRIAAFAARWKTTPVWIRAQPTQCGVSNSYPRPEMLGADRWATLIGARQLEKSPCLVVSAGTALTIDALSGEGRFMGGLILPGFALMREALTRGTAGLVSEPGKFVRFPANTADAITSGIINSQAGAVERMAGFMSNASEAPRSCLITGGAARRLAECLSLPIRLVEDLALTGLARIAVEET
jgi:type III pantothenate kinase